MQIFQDHEYALNVCQHYREILKSLTLTAVIRDQMQAVEFLGSHLKPLMTDAEQESFRGMLRAAKGVAKVNAEQAERIVANNLKQVLSHVPPSGDKPNGNGGDAVVNPTPKPPIRPNDGAAVALPMPTVSVRQAKAQMKAQQTRMW